VGLSKSLLGQKPYKRNLIRPNVKRCEPCCTRVRAPSESRRVWTLELAAEVSFEQGLTTNQVSIETIRQALKRLGVGWQRAKDWITSPDPHYAQKKKTRCSDRTGEALWLGGWPIWDEVWWSRLSQPKLHSWSEQGEPLRLQERSKEKNDLIPKRSPVMGCFLRQMGVCTCALSQAAP